MTSTPSTSPSAHSALTTATTPLEPPSPTLNPTDEHLNEHLNDHHPDNDTSDIWASSPILSPSDPTTTHAHSNSALESHPPNPHPESRSRELLSDLPSLRRQHVTSGYREGLSVGKARVIQSAFDEGYPVGVELAVRVGTVLGVLEGCVGALSDSRGQGGKGIGNAVGDAKNGGEGEKEWKARLENVQRLLDKAKTELDVAKLLEGMEEGVLVGAKSAVDLKNAEEVVRRWEELVFGGLRDHERDEVKRVDEG